MPRDPAEVRLSPEAERDMEVIWLYTFEQWGLDQAIQYTNDLTAAFSQLRLWRVLQGNAHPR